MIKRPALFFLLSVMSCLVTAHEFWLEPDRFYFKPGETATVNFRVGEHFVGEPWKVSADRIVRIQHHFGREVRDLKKVLSERATDPLLVPLPTEGSHILVMESTPAFIKLDGEKFRTYLEEDGLDEVLYQRKEAGISGDSASEFYSRHTKLFLQAGSKLDDNHKKVFNLPIEIVPDKNPAALRKGDPIAFTVFFEGQPLFGAKVKVLNRHNQRTSVQNIFTQQDGKIETHISNPGAWMVSVVKMVPSKNPSAQYRSYWGTLVFGIRE